MSESKIHEAVQDGQHNANEVMREVYKAMKRMDNDTAKYAFKEELLRKIEMEFEWFDIPQRKTHRDCSNWHYR